MALEGVAAGVEGSDEVVSDSSFVAGDEGESLLVNLLVQFFVLEFELAVFEVFFFVDLVYLVVDNHHGFEAGLDFCGHLLDVLDHFEL